MAKRVKRLEKGVESLKKQIEDHFQKIEKDLQENMLDRGRYHVKEIDKSLLKVLELKLNLLGIRDNSLLLYKERLNSLKQTLSINET